MVFAETDGWKLCFWHMAAHHYWCDKLQKGIRHSHHSCTTGRWLAVIMQHKRSLFESSNTWREGLTLQVKRKCFPEKTHVNSKFVLAFKVSCFWQLRHDATNMQIYTEILPAKQILFCEEITSLWKVLPSRQHKIDPISHCPDYLNLPDNSLLLKDSTALSLEKGDIKVDPLTLSALFFFFWRWGRI